MSAFVVNHSHIDVLVEYFLNNSLYNGRAWDFDAMNPDEVGYILLRENIRSVNYRYKEHSRFTVYNYKKPYNTYSNFDIYNAVRCLSYQSCERKDWIKSNAYDITDRIEKDVLRKILKSHPDYDTLVWELHDNNRIGELN